MQPGADLPKFVTEMNVKSAQLRARAEELRAQLAAVTESVTSPDRRVTVTVGAGGVMQGIKIESAGLRSTPTEWSTAVMRAYSQGCRLVGARAAELVEQHAPTSPVAAMMREAIPPPLEDEEEPS